MSKARQRKIDARQHRQDVLHNIGKTRTGHSDLIQREPKLVSAEKKIESSKVVQSKLVRGINHSTGASLEKTTAKGKR
jgi:hypothetical protein